MTKVYHYTESCSFNELLDIHQMCIADLFCQLIKARKPDVIKRIMNVSNPGVHYNLSNDKTRITNFQFSQEGKEVLTIAMTHYLHEAL